MQTPIEEKLPQPSALVRVRSRQYLVEELTPPPDPSSQTLVRLSCLDDDSQGTSLEVLWESEVDAQILQAATWQDVARKGFDPPPKFSAYLHTLRWNSVTSTNPRLFQSPLSLNSEVGARFQRDSSADFVSSSRFRRQLRRSWNSIG